MSARTALRTKQRANAKPGFFGRLLDPIDRLAEMIFSILILLTFTLAYRVWMLGSDPNVPLPADYATDLALAAFGAILAWGVIGGVMYALLGVFERGEKHRLLARIQNADSDPERIAVIAEEFDFSLEPITHEGQRQALYADVLDHLRDSRPQPVGFTRDDLTGALGCVLVAVLAVLPSLAPLLLLRDDYQLALRVSNVVSFSMLFYAGWQWGQHAGSSPWRTGLLLFALGGIMALIAILLGG